MTINENSAVLSLNGTEVKIEFLHHWSFIAVENLSGSDVKISRSENIEGRTDGVIIIPAGGSVNYSVIDGKLYLIGTGTVNVMGTSSSENPFKVAGKGGGGGSGTTESYNDLQNKPQINGVEISGNKTEEEYGIIIPDTSNMVVNPSSEAILTGPISVAPTPTETGINVSIQTHTLNSTESVNANFNIELVSENGPGLISFEDKTIIDGVLPAETSIPDNATDEKIPTSKAVQLFVLSNLVSLGFKPTIVNELPETGQTNFIYLVPRINGITGDNIHDEYLWIGDRYELLASTGIDLSDYATKEFLINYFKSYTDSELSLTSENAVQNKVVTKAIEDTLLSAKDYADDKDESLKQLLTTSINGKLNKNDISSWALSPTKPSYTAAEVGADKSGSANTALASAKGYTDSKITDLVGAAPATLDTIYKIAAAIQNDQTAITAINNAITTKVNKSDVKTNMPSSPTDTEILSAKLVKDLLSGYVTKDQLASQTVTGIKGDAETSYRRGDVNITQENLGLHIESAKISVPNTNYVIANPIVFDYVKEYTTNTKPAINVFAFAAVQEDASGYLNVLDPSLIRLGPYRLNGITITLKSSAENKPPHSFDIIAAYVKAE